MKFKSLVALIAAFSTSALALEGSVQDSQGRPIPNAKIEVVGSRNTATSDSEGAFTISVEGAEEVHIKATGFSHKALHLDDLEEDATLNIVLVRTVIEQVDVIGLPIHASVIESAQPIAVLSGETLRNRQAATLGDSLKNEVGVHTNFHGNVASTPVIRGLSGPRVLIAQNNLDVSDVSRVGPDHAVASEVSTAEQVEILRGPATLFYGSGAIGGVVNVVDKRVPTETGTYGEWQLAHETVNDQQAASFNLNTGKNIFAFHLDGFWRESDDYEVPVNPERGHEEAGDYRVANSADESQGFTLGGSYLLDNGYVGLALGQLNREYGIPGHAHGGEEHESDEDAVYADLEQDRYQLISELDLDNAWLSAINTRVGYTDYEHAEVEEGRVGTLFSNKTTEFKLDLMQQPFADWKGGLVLHFKDSDVFAEGDEAFTPPSESETLGVAVIQEKHFGDVLLQLGARVERVNITADKMLLPELEAHSHEEVVEEEHDHGAPDLIRVFSSDQEFTPVSVSLGAVWDFKPGYNFGLSLSHAQRAPSASELLSFGPHIGTRSYEIGALFALHEDEGESHFEINEAALDLESSNNIDVSFRKHEGDLGIILNAFYNQVDNYYYQAATGLFAESAHAHEHDEHAHAEEDEHADELPVYVFNSADAGFYGFEAQGIWQINPYFQVTLFSDYIHAELKDSGAALPRTPPLRYGARLNYTWNALSAELDWAHYDDQDDVAELESETEGYDWLDASLTWTLPLQNTELSLFVKAENLTDTEARVHTSFLKDIAPKPGRNFRLGLRGTF